MGGGLLVLGRVEVPGIRYTPLVLPSRSHYSLDLRSISINRKTVAIDAAVFATSSNRGTIVDSSTLLACLPSDAYVPFVTADHEVSDSDAETLSALVELFVEKATHWSQVVHALNCIDVLRSFAVTANSSCGSMCRPVLLPANSSSMISCQETGGLILKIKGLWHPYALGENGGTIVPNDMHLGEDSTGYCPRTLLLTGTNMGGKSTLLRSTCLAVILAQLGCYVPSEMCVLSPVDIIFTRLGATDRIMTGESTFLIECTETASVLQNATCDSLVLLDELGRGTSTFDGYAIAYAVFRHLVEKVNCRLLFATTHYHSLTKEFSSHPHVKLQHMACSFKPKTGSSFNGDQELVFLYRLTSGACPESYGLQVALMAGISKQVVEVAAKAREITTSPFYFFMCYCILGRG